MTWSLKVITRGSSLGLESPFDKVFHAKPVISNCGNLTKFSLYKNSWYEVYINTNEIVSVVIKELEEKKKDVV